MNTIPFPPADSAPDSNSGTNAGDPRLTALALGEISDVAEARVLSAAIAADPRLQREFTQTQALAEALRGAFSAELEAPCASGAAESASPRFGADTVAPGVPSAPPSRRRRSGGFGALVSHHEENAGKNNILRFFFAGASALGAAALLFFALRVHEPAPLSSPPPDTVAARTTPAAPIVQPGSIRLRPQTEDGYHVAARTPRPGSIHVAIPTSSPGAVSLASLVSRLPARIPHGGENAFVPIENPPREIALSLASTGRDYARKLHDSIALGRLPNRELLRVDGLVNAFACVPDTASALPGIDLVAEVVPAPWAPGHWLVRTTVQAGGTDTSIAATQARAAATFFPAQAASWRLLGCEDGGENAPALELPAEIRSGEVLTTLFELVPAPGAKAGESLGELKIAFTDKAGKRVELTRKIAWPAPGGMEAATDETRVAAAAAALGLALRQSPHRGSATVALAGRIVGAAHHPDRALFDLLLRDSAVLVRN